MKLKDVCAFGHYFARYILDGRSCYYESYESTDSIRTRSVNLIYKDDLYSTKIKDSVYMLKEKL